ncbi:uncharacterized protein C8Q71DRAFT_851877 [Rhodofomes roseus]|uniref:Uncharacterized protein n=1 Tax=Rhodofomes roseus TaxID=34475 RepID=A0ABQ8JY09_9APHY|nr:uncharacterized protein C8Q71DRAFT_851877 [Rhodofomes roseus]KAH9829052.1 hypothetical protein C8Q71DRAFT_851877 [Rhodofomes roseus]
MVQVPAMGPKAAHAEQPNRRARANARPPAALRSGTEGSLRTLTVYSLSSTWRTIPLWLSRSSRVASSYFGNAAARVDAATPGRESDSSSPLSAVTPLSALSESRVDELIEALEEEAARNSTAGEIDAPRRSPPRIQPSPTPSLSSSSSSSSSDDSLLVSPSNMAPPVSELKATSANAAVSQASQKHAPVVTPGKLTPAVLLQWEAYCVAFFRKQKIGDADKVAEVAPGFQDELIPHS